MTSAFYKLKARLANEDPAPSDDLLMELIDSAAGIINSRRFPIGEYQEEVEPRYVDLQSRIALAMYNKIGGEYEIEHTENGITRKWSSEDIPESLLFEITPKVGTLQ